jgi:hypothetical protein
MLGHASPGCFAWFQVMVVQAYGGLLCAGVWYGGLVACTVHTPFVCAELINVCEKRKF